MAFSISYMAGGTLDSVGNVEKVNFIEGVHGFAEFLMPYNTMEYKDIPGTPGIHTMEIVLPDMPMELIGFTVSATGYGEHDCYDLYLNDHKAFDHWYLQEVKEGLFIGSSTFVYRMLPKSTVRLEFNNASATRKIIYLGIRALIPSAKQLEEINATEQENSVSTN